MITSFNITAPDTHSIGWARATASFWGVSRANDLDEAVRLTEVKPVRLRVEGLKLLLDRALSFKTETAGSHAALRFYFDNGQFYEVEIEGLRALNHGETAEVRT